VRLAGGQKSQHSLAILYDCPQRAGCGAFQKAPLWAPGRSEETAHLSSLPLEFIGGSGASSRLHLLAP
jgi:hypothetical protein